MVSACVFRPKHLHAISIWMNEFARQRRYLLHHLQEIHMFVVDVTFDMLSQHRQNTHSSHTSSVRNVQLVRLCAHAKTNITTVSSVFVIIYVRSCGVNNRRCVLKRARTRAHTYTHSWTIARKGAWRLSPPPLFARSMTAIVNVAKRTGSRAISIKCKSSTSTLTYRLPPTHMHTIDGHWHTHTQTHSLAAVWGHTHMP